MKSYLNQLRSRFPDYGLHLLVHSQGNAVVSDAIKQGAPFDTYILTQGALPASTYDVNAATNTVLLNREVSPYLTPDLQPLGYRGTYTNLTGRLVNFFNTNDFVLGVWIENHRFGKPSQFYSYNGTNCWYLYDSDLGLYRQVTDSQESRAMIARSRTQPIGRLGPTVGQISQGIIGATVNLNTQFGFFDSVDEHSAQWTRPIQTSRPYYIQVLDSITP